MSDQKPQEQAEKQAQGRADHLRPHQFKPGQSGNPGGRPKGSLGVWNRVRRELERRTDDGQQLADMVAKAIVKELLRGNFKFVKEFLDRDEGPVKQQIEFGKLEGLAGVVAHLDEQMKETGDADQRAATAAAEPEEPGPSVAGSSDGSDET